MNIKVTLFEDNAALRLGLFQLIQGSPGFECTGAYPDCLNMLEKIESNIPNVVLMDIGLPQISGIDAVRILKSAHPEIRILMQTVFDNEDKIFDSLCAGASGYILKNTPVVRILESIREVHEGGAALSPSVALKVMKMAGAANKSGQHDPGFQLSTRENEILALLVKGMSYKLIGDACNISIDTVRGHIRHIYDKMHVHSKSEAVVKALKNNIV